MNKKYLDLVPYYNKNKPFYIASLDIFDKYITDIKDLLKAIQSQTNFDNATGTQLDIIGELIGLTRNLEYPILEGIYRLEDKEFRDMLQLKRLITHSQLTNDQIINILKTKYTSFFLSDTLDMSYVTIILASPAHKILEQLLVTGNISIQPMAVGSNYIIEEDTSFGWNMNNLLIQGWDVGKWR